ncbi:MAG TPA: cupredoxin domain-containing protein [Methanoregula sp.]|nr:cupredoxin domain-containing protein [Methanoregula sp.]
MKRILLLSIAVVFILLIAGCTQSTGQKEPVATATQTPAPTSPTYTYAKVTTVPTTVASVTDNTIVISSSGFSQPQITVKEGSIVRWVNKDKAIHSVVFETEAKINPSGVMSNSQSFSVKFYEAGTYPYHCGVHPEVTGTVIVTR